MNYKISNDTGKDYNKNGTGEFSFSDCIVTSAVDETALFVNDPIVNGQIVNNEDMPFPKLVDIDVDYQLIKASVFGMNFGVKWPGGDGLAFKGDWQLNVIAQDLWSRSICTDVTPDIESHRYGAKSVTRLRNLSWGEDVNKSPVLRQLKERVENGAELSVSMSIYFYTRNHPAYLFTNFTLGHVVGTIGIAESNEPMNFNGDRLLSFEGVQQPQDINLAKNDSCFKYEISTKNHPHWMYKAPFHVYRKFQQRRLSVDLSNSLPFDLDGKLRHLGNLTLGILNAEADNCIEQLGKSTIPYLEENWLTKTGGVVDYILTGEQFQLLENSKLVVTRVRQPVEGLWHDSEMRTDSVPVNLYTACSSEDTNILEIMLQENPKFIRPMNYYVSRLSYKESFEVDLLVTNYGKPVANEFVHVFLSNGDRTQPLNGVMPTSQVATTNSSGIATFTFLVKEKIPFPREYKTKQCQPPTQTLSIEGQVYMFKYNTSGTCVHDVNNTVTQLTCVNDITILAFSYVELPPQPNWVDNISSIFSQYDRLYPVMHQMIDLANYTAVTLPQNIQLLKYAMALDISHPGYMPVTRDLSPTKQRMILNWLDNPTYNKSSATPSKTNANTPICSPPHILAAMDYRDHYFHPPRCTKENILTEDVTVNMSGVQKSVKLPTYFTRIFETNLSLYQAPPRPLLQFNLKAKDKQCTHSSLLAQLQQAVELEFATLPVYLTSLYSIVEGCNTEVYRLIHSVIMQEMLHMTQAANVLISLGGEPIIDSRKAVPKYPKIGLPGGVLPHLRVTLEKLSLVHIYEVFMGIEVPHNVSADHYSDDIFNNTIGQFYKEIEACIEYLGDSAFVGRVNEQVKWPWNATTIGILHIVTDVKSAKEGIEEIVEQGEGAGPLDPTEGNPKELAHFYKFEEIVCRKHLVNTTQNGTRKYAYTGPEIAFDQSGVWPMRENPCKDCIPPHNNCYTEAKAFHQAYRALLKKLQSVFSGNPDKIKEAIDIMESLAVHARKLMWTKIRDDDYLTCGPVWDYNWDD